MISGLPGVAKLQFSASPPLQTAMSMQLCLTLGYTDPGWPPYSCHTLTVFQPVVLYFFKFHLKGESSAEKYCGGLMLIMNHLLVLSGFQSGG